MFKFIKKLFKKTNKTNSFTGAKEIEMLNGDKVWVACYNGYELGYIFKSHSDGICTCEGDGDTFKTVEEANRVLYLYLSQNRK